MSTSFWNVVLRHWVIDVQYCDTAWWSYLQGSERSFFMVFSTLEYGTITLSQNTTHQLPSDVAHIPEERGPRPPSSVPESQTEDIPDTSHSVPAVSSCTV